jgi:hypothetical protein
MPIMRLGKHCHWQGLDDDPDDKGMGVIMALETMGLFWQISVPRLRTTGSDRGPNVQTTARAVGVTPESMAIAV